MIVSAIGWIFGLVWLLVALATLVAGHWITAILVALIAIPMLPPGYRGHSGRM